MKKFVLLITFLPLVSFATSKSDILRLTSDIETALADSQASSADLDEARQGLEQVLRLVTDGSSNTKPNECIDFAYAKYYSSFNSSDAMDAAAKACKSIADVKIAKYLWEKHYANLNSAAAMDLAAQGATRATAGKLEIVKFAWEKYYSSLASSAAATKAAESAKKVARNGLSCVQTAWSKYYSSKSSADAMDAAAVACSKER